MAGGEGTRLRPLTSNAPKPMLPIANRPMMEHIITLLKRHGFDEIVVTVQFMANAIKNYFGDGAEFGVTIVYADEPTPLGTAGSVRNAMEHLDERFLVISGDVITDVDLTKIVAFHDDREAMATIGLIRVDNPLEFGIVITDEDGAIERFLEKPTWGQVFSDTINTGIYVLDPEIFDYIDPGRSGRLLQRGLPRAARRRQAASYGAVAEGYWEDVGTLDGLPQRPQGRARPEGAARHPRLPHLRRRVAGRGGRGVARRPGRRAGGDRAGLQGGGRLPASASTWCSAPTCGCSAAPTSSAPSSTTTSTSAPGARIRGTVIGRASNIRANVRCDEGVVLGDEVFVGENAVLGNDVKVYPFKTIEDGAVVNSSIVWESRGARSLFGREGVSGLANVDITPELAAKVAMAYGTSLRKGTTVVTSPRLEPVGADAQAGDDGRASTPPASTCSTSRWRRMPVTRFLVRSPRAFGGLSVRLEPRRSPERGRALLRHHRRRHPRGRPAQDRAPVPAGGLPPGAARGDRRHQLPAPGPGGLHRRPREHRRHDRHLTRHRFKLVVDYGYGATSFVMPNVLAKLGADVLAVNPFASTGGIIGFDAARAPRAGGRPRAGVGRPPRRRARPRRRAAVR